MYKIMVCQHGKYIPSKTYKVYKTPHKIIQEFELMFSYNYSSTNEIEI